MPAGSQRKREAEVQRLLAGKRCRLSVRHLYFNLPKQANDLLRTMLLSSCHSRLLSYQFVASTPVQKQPGIPNPRDETGSGNVRFRGVQTLSSFRHRMGPIRWFRRKLI
jgi:hypothetical protein